MGPVLGWDKKQTKWEVDNYQARVAAEIASQQQPNDEAADELRVAAPEARREILEPVPAPE